MRKDLIPRVKSRVYRLKAYNITSLLLLTALLTACIQKDNTIPLEDAYSEIHAAISVRIGRCGNQPGYPLLILDSPPSYGLRLCSLLIIQGECPFNDYPVGCIEMYTNECDSCDLPGFNP